MKYEGVCIAVKDVNLSKKFYQDLFDLEVFQDYGINVSFGGLSLQQEFDWLTGVPKESILEKAQNHPPQNTAPYCVPFPIYFL